jgi:predicted NAD/FAD-binding protein
MDEHVFSHPIFDQKAIDAQTRIPEIQGVRGLWFCGAYQRYGFHEDGLLSAVNVVKKMGGEIPWEN